MFRFNRTYTLASAPLFVALHLLCSTANAAEVVGIKVADDLALAKQGSVLELTSSFLPGDASLSVRVSAYAMTTDTQATVRQTPISSRKTLAPWTYSYAPFEVPKSQDQQPKASFNRISIPVEDLFLGEGTHTVRYLVESLDASGKSVSSSYSTPGNMTINAGAVEWTGLEEAKAKEVTGSGAGPGQEDYPQPPTGSPDVMVAPGLVSSGPTGSGFGSKANVVEQQPPLQPAKVWPARTQAQQDTVQWRALNNPLNTLEDASHTLVYFVSNRPWHGVKDITRPWEGLGTTYQPFDKLDKITYGAAVVRTPLDRKMGDLNSVQLEGLVGPYPESRFTPEQNQAASRFLEWIWGQDVLVFIHGYNNTFEAAAEQAAQLKLDLKFPGPVVIFSWPSLAEGGGYFTDKLNAEKSLPAFADLLIHFAQGNDEDPAKFFCPPGKTFFIAHSMGNWVFLNAMGLANARRKLRMNSFGKVVLASPDVSKVSFLQWSPLVIGASRNVTVYYSHKDTALDLSSIIHRGKRAGQGNGVQYVAGVDAIDVDNVNSRWIRHGHSAFSASDKVLTDIALNFIYDVPVWNRSPPLVRKPSLLDYFSNWSFPAE